MCSYFITLPIHALVVLAIKHHAYNHLHYFLISCEVIYFLLNFDMLVQKLIYSPYFYLLADGYYQHVRRNIVV